MKTNLFNYELSEDLIAQTPLENRGESRLLVCHSGKKSIVDKHFYEIPEVLNEIFKLNEKKARVLLIANDSRVYPARVRIKRKTGARGEVFFLERGEKDFYSCLLRPKSKLKIGEILYADNDNLTPLFKVANLNEPSVSLVEDKSLDSILEEYGEMPLPPYIHRDSLKNSSYKNMDKERYQTVYSNKNEIGSSASPTAGLHFTPELINKCEQQEIEFAYVTLHVGLGTFLPVQSDLIEQHEMHEEYYYVPQTTAEKIIEFTEKGWPIVFIGTTSLRAIESFFRLACKNQDREDIFNLAKQKQLSIQINPYLNKWTPTKIFIHPNNKEECIKPCIGNAIITNFHQPGSTLAMLIAALMGYHFWKEFYTYAIEKKYRFFSYGDSSLLVFGESF